MICNKSELAFYSRHLHQRGGRRHYPSWYVQSEQRYTTWNGGLDRSIGGVRVTCELRINCSNTNRFRSDTANNILGLECTLMPVVRHLT